MGRISGLAPASVTYTISHLGGITLDTGTGSNTVNVYGTGTGETDVIGHSGSTTVNIGNGTLTSIRNSVTVTDPPSFSTVNVDDSADTATRTATLNTWSFENGYGQISGFTGEAWIFFKYNDTSTVTLKTGTGTNSVNVLDVVKPLTLFRNSSSTTVPREAALDQWADSGRHTSVCRLCSGMRG